MWIAFGIGVLIGFIGGSLAGRRNRAKVEDVVAKVKKEYEDYKYKEMRG